MRATQTLQNNWPHERLWNWGILPPTQESAAPTRVKQVHVNSLDVEGTVFQTF